MVENWLSSHVSRFASQVAGLNISDTVLASGEHLRGAPIEGKSRDKLPLLPALDSLILEPANKKPLDRTSSYLVIAWWLAPVTSLPTLLH